MTPRTHVQIGLALWLIATAHLTSILAFPFLSDSADTFAWKLLLSPLGLTALAGCIGYHCIDRHGRFWTLKRLLGLSAVALTAVYATILFQAWHGAEKPFLDERFSLLLLINVIVTGPLGCAGAVLLTTGKRKQGRK